MSTMTENDTMTMEELELLSRFFRLMLKELCSDEDKENLAPGEMGINYTTGALYVRNPHTGELFSPNSLEDLRGLVRKYNPLTNVLNADTVRGIRFYTSVADLAKVDYAFTPDLVVRQMRSPSVFFGPIMYEAYDELGWPSERGMCLILKVNEECVRISYTDSISTATFDGRYNTAKHMFEGWILGDGYGCNPGKVENLDGHSVIIVPTDRIDDLMVITGLVVDPIGAYGTISVNNRTPEPLYTMNFEPLGVDIAANNLIMLVYDKPEGRWIVLESTDSAWHAVATILASRISDSEADLDRVERELEATKQTLFDLIERNRRELRDALNEADERLTEEIRRTNLGWTAAIEEQNRLRDEAIELVNSSWSAAYTDLRNQMLTMSSIYDAQINNLWAALRVTVGRVTTTNVTVVQGVTEVNPVTNYVPTNGDALLYVNYGQTILKEGIDYRVIDSGVFFADGIEFSGLDIVQFVILKSFNETVEIVRDTRTVDDDTTYLDDVQGYDPDKDAILSVNYGQTVLMQERDFIIDDGGIRLIGITIPKGETVQIAVFKNRIDEVRVVTYTAEEEVRSIPLDGFVYGSDNIVSVNYGQTVLKASIDYVVGEGSIALTGLTIPGGETVQVVILKADS